MGINNTKYKRVTVYLKEAQLNFLDGLIKEFSGPNISTPSRSDVIRAILDSHCNTEDWQTIGLLEKINQRTKDRF